MDGSIVAFVRRRRGSDGQPACDEVGAVTYPSEWDGYERNSFAGWLSSALDASQVQRLRKIHLFRSRLTGVGVGREDHNGFDRGWRRSVERMMLKMSTT